MARVRQFANDLGISKNQAQNLINKGRSRKDGGSQILESVMKKPVKAKKGKANRMYSNDAEASNKNKNKKTSEQIVRKINEYDLTKSDITASVDKSFSEKVAKQNEKAKKNVKNFETGMVFSSKYNWKHNCEFLVRARLVYRRSKGSIQEFIKDTKLEDVFLTIGNDGRPTLVNINFVDLTDSQNPHVGAEKSTMFDVSMHSDQVPYRVKEQSSNHYSFFEQRRWRDYDVSTWEVVGYQEKGTKEIVWKEGCEGNII